MVNYAGSGPWVTEPLASGEAVMLRTIANNGGALVSGNVQLTYFTARKTESCGHVTTTTSDTAAATQTYAAVGVYTVDAAGNLALAAQSGDLHGTLWASTFVDYAAALTTPLAKQAGQKYALAALSVAGTPPKLTCAFPSGIYFSAPPVMMGVVTSQAALPASITAGSIVAGPTFGMVMQGIIAP